MVNRIIVSDKIYFYGDFGKETTVKVSAYSAADTPTLIAEFDATIKDGCFSIQKVYEKKLLKFCRFKTKFGGVEFPSEVIEGEQRELAPISTKKGLSTHIGPGREELGFKHLVVTVNICDAFDTSSGLGTTDIELEGKMYHFNNEFISMLSNYVKFADDNHVYLYFHLIANKNTLRGRVPGEWGHKLIHPSTLWYHNASAFNLVNDENLDYYKAFCMLMTGAFIIEKIEDFGGIGFIIGDEVNESGYLGKNKQHLIEEVVDTYTRAARIAYLAGQNKLKNLKLYVSLGSWWGVPVGSFGHFAGLDFLREMRKNCKANGDFYYQFAPRLFGKDIFKTDFWNNDEASGFNDSNLLTLKNLEVLQEFVNEDENKYEGKVRKIMLSGPGFDIGDGETNSLDLQYQAFGRAYRKVMRIPEIESFIYYVATDQLDDHGAKFGLMDWTGEEKRPIYYLFKDIDQIDPVATKSNKKGAVENHYVWEQFEDVETELKHRSQWAEENK